jgi:hypothetical protein
MTARSRDTPERLGGDRHNVDERNPMIERPLETFEVTTPSGATLVVERIGVVVDFGGQEAIGSWIYRLRDGRELRPNPLDRKRMLIVETGETVCRLGLA